MLSRRQFITRSGAAGAAVVLAPQAALDAAANGKAKPLLRGGRFRQGVLSGDPTPRGITLLTVVDDVKGAGAVRVEVARDRDFRRVVARRKIATSGARGHSVKVRLGGLEPDERYFYRFETRDRESPVGRFQTALPADSNRPVRFAFFSCNEYTHGYFNAFDAMARDDIDFVVCLGDYVYGEAYHSVAGAAPGGRPGVLRGDAVLRPGQQPRLPLRAPRPQRRPDHARPAPVPRRPAVRRRRRPAVRRLGPAAGVPGPAPDELAQAAPADLEGALEGDRLADDDDAGQGHRRLVLRVRQLAGLR